MLVEKIKDALSDSANSGKLDTVQGLLEDIDGILDAIQPFLPSPASEGVALIDKILEVIVSLIDSATDEDEKQV